MDPNRKQWNQRQQELLRVLKKPADHERAAALFLEQHAAVHSGAMSRRGGWSFDDEVWQGLDDAAARCIPPGGEHSIAWMFWHVTRIEDITMNLLVAGEPQRFYHDGWVERLNAPFCDTGNEMDPAAIAALSDALDLAALREYRLAVGRRTEEIIRGCAPGDFQREVDPARLRRVLEEGAVPPNGTWLTDYWGSHQIAGLLLMPATRHIFVHCNEALRVKAKVLRARR